ncbi:TetR/AcrR family transcriptional regulator [Deinococcus fonticola]|uniref:TetR/AcrR family transcriptional regulator n=1 Tax=Deinococcus fonticola TaxID=2528713 RepID=UPI001074ACA5|nr:TetR family transcriptional regulator [Deinococcus fonticola]
MRHNAARRAALLDATLTILAREGTRGLSYRTLDAEARLPTGTASNYFRNRAELLRQAAEHVHFRLQPDADWLESTLQRPPGRELLTELLQNLVQRVLQDRTAYLSLLELRLEATRRPELQDTLRHTLNHHFYLNRNFGPTHGLPLTHPEFTLIYLTISGLLIEELTLPGLLEETTPDELMQRLVEIFTPSGPWRP